MEGSFSPTTKVGGRSSSHPRATRACTGVARYLSTGRWRRRAWDYEIVIDDEDELAVNFQVVCSQLPLSVDRLIRLVRNSPTIAIEETISNESEEQVQFVWGHHCVLGPPFIEPGCQLDVPAGRIVTPEALWEESARLLPGQRSRWPMAVDRQGELVDLSTVSGPEAGSHDDVYLTELSGGWISVHNPRLDLVFTMRFDHELFRCVVSWQPFGGATAMPLKDCYGLGVEPWTSLCNLEHSVRSGAATELSGGASLETVLTVTVEREAGRG